MTVDELLKSDKVYWDGDYGMMHQPSGYVRCVALRKGLNVELTPFGATLANTSASTVQSVKKRSKKQEQPVVDELDLGDI